MQSNAHNADLPSVRVVVLAYGEEPLLSECVTSALRSEGIDVAVTVVDNGAKPESIAALPKDPRIQLVVPSENLGFAGGVNYGAANAAEDFLVLLNSDAIAAPDALAKLVHVASRDEVGIATPSLRLASDPSLLNSAGNPLHYTGLSWAGAFGEPASSFVKEREVASCTGAGATMRMSWWRELRGFDDTFFAYQEDVDLSWRTWMLGKSVVYVPDAVIVHDYEFSRNPTKLFLLERNRGIVRSTLFGPRLRFWSALPNTMLGVALRMIARNEGWLQQKRDADAWLKANREYILDRRKLWQSRRTVSDQRLAYLIDSEVTPAMIESPKMLRVLNAGSRLYWSVVRRFI